MKIDKEYIVSVIMPLYNEEKYIDDCIQSLFKQDYDRNMMEWIFVDGLSTDKTREILEKYHQQYPTLIRILRNDYKTVPYAMNIGIKEAKGQYIIRMDAHASYDDSYIYQNVYIT